MHQIFFLYQSFFLGVYISVSNIFYWQNHWINTLVYWSWSLSSKLMQCNKSLSSKIQFLGYFYSIYKTQRYTNTFTNTVWKQFNSLDAHWSSYSVQINVDIFRVNLQNKLVLNSCSIEVLNKTIIPLNFSTFHFLLKKKIIQHLNFKYIRSIRLQGEKFAFWSDNFFVFIIILTEEFNEKYF